MQRLLIVQHGDYAEAYSRFQDGGAETYRDQRRSVDFVASLAPTIETTTIAVCPRTYDIELAPNLRAVAIPQEDFGAGRAKALFETYRPDALMLRTPRLDMLREANRRGVRVLPLFADLFEKGGLKSRLWAYRLRRALSGRNVPCVANHSLNASRSLVSVIGMPPDRVVPWDWTPLPVAGPAKPGMGDPARPRGFFAGALSAPKGVGDCLKAIARLHERGIPMTMSFAGPGDTAHWTAEAEGLGIADAVRFLGRIPNAEVRDEMRRHDLVLVPSRHSYPEGLPNTIYEGLASRSVLMVSDHPAFRGRLRPDDECVVFSASDPVSLAEAITGLCRDPEKYRRLSENAERALAGLYVGMEWEALVGAFLKDPEDRTGWVARNSLEALGK